MAGQTLSTLANALKKDYHGPLVDALNNMSVLYAVLEKNTEDVSGENLQAVVALKTARNQGIGARAEGGALPTARYTKTLKLAIPLAYTYGAIQFTGQVLKAAETDAKAFAKVVDLEVNGMAEAMKIDINRQMHGFGNGMLCMTNGAGAGADATVTVDAPGTKWLEEGMPIESFADLTSSTQGADEDISQGLTEATSHIVGEITSDTTFELQDYTGAAVSTEQWHDNHYITRWGARANEMTGLARIIADVNCGAATGGWMGIADQDTVHYLGDGSTAASRTTYPILNAVIKHNNNTNRAISEMLIQDLLDAIEQKSGKKGENKSLILETTYGVRKAYIDLLQADRRYTQPLKLVGGWQAIGYQAGNDLIPFIVDRHAMPNGILCLDRRFIQVYRASDFDWMDMDGNMFQRKIDSNGRYDAYEAVMYCYQSLGCTSFKNQGALRDITEPAT